MGEGVRFATGEALTSSSMERAPFESLSPPDPSLIVIGSPSPPDRGARGSLLLLRAMRLDPIR